MWPTIELIFDNVYEIQTAYFNPIISNLIPNIFETNLVTDVLMKLPWLFYLVLSSVVFLIIPAALFISLYITAVTIYIYRHRVDLELKKIGDFAAEGNWRGFLYFIAVLWEAHGCLWHGYEVRGFENIPKKGPALIVYYHGAIPLDHYYLIVKCFLYRKRLIHAVGDHFLFMLPGAARLMSELRVLPGPASRCVEILQNGHLLSVSPGGVREALFGDENYNLIWKNRIGFAKVTSEAKVPIIPVFTKNLREAFVASKVGRGYLRMIYEYTRLPVVPIYGGFPVKLITYIGKPIHYDPCVPPQELAKKTQFAIEDLIRQHQRLPGSITKALLARFYWRRRSRKSKLKEANNNRINSE